MKAGDTVYRAAFGTKGPIIERMFVTEIAAWVARCVPDGVIMGGCVRDPGGKTLVRVHDLHPTLPAALAWLIERTAARLTEQEQAAAQTRETLGELQAMLEGVSDDG